MTTEINYVCDMPGCPSKATLPQLVSRPPGWVTVRLISESDAAPQSAYSGPQVFEELLFCAICWEEHFTSPGVGLRPFAKDIRAAVQSMVFAKVYIERKFPGAHIERQARKQ